MTPHTSCHHQLYRLTCADFDALRERSNGCCEICGTPEPETPTGVLHIDHDGRYGWAAVRGLLCPKCNALMRYVDGGQKEDLRAGTYLRNAWFMRHVWPKPRTTVKGDR